MMLTYLDAQKELSQEYDDKVKRLENHKKLFPIADEYCEQFSQDHDFDIGKRTSWVSYAADSGTVKCLLLTVYIGSQEKIQDILPIIHKIIKDHRLEMTKPLTKTIKDLYEPLEITFKEAQSDNGAKLMVRLWLYHSTKCKLVGTGEFEEKKKVVCE